MQLGVVAAVTISVLLMRLFADCALPTLAAPLHCGVLEPSRTIGRTVFVLMFTALLKVNKMVLSLHFDKLSVYVPVIKAAIMRRGFICTSLTGITSGTIRLATTGTFAS